MIAGQFLRPEHPHTTSNGAPELGSCQFAGEIIIDVLTNDIYVCDAVSGNPGLSDPGDAYNTVSNGTDTADADDSSTLQFPAFVGITPGNPTVLSWGQARETYYFGCSDTATATEYLLASAGRATTACVASGDNTDGRYLVASNQVLQPSSFVCQAAGSPAGPDTGDTWTMTVQDTGTDTALVCTMTNPATTCTGTGTAHTLAQNDRVSIKKVDSDGAFDGNLVRCVVEAFYQ